MRASLPFKLIDGNWVDYLEIEERLENAKNQFSLASIGNNATFDATSGWAERMLEHVEPIDFVVYPFFPIGVISSFYASGGSGKSFYLVGVAIRLALGRPVMGQLPKPPMKVLFLSGEDPMREVIDRMGKILNAANLVDGDMELLDENLIMPDLMLTDIGMITFTPEMGMGPPTMKMTSFGSKFERSIKELQPDLVIVDPLGDTYQDDENNRSKVSKFMTRMSKIASENDCSLVIVAHPSKGADSQYSGSTAWDSKTRSRLWMSKKEDTLTIEHVKQQYSKKAADIAVTWEPEYPTEAIEEDMHKMQTMRLAECKNHLLKVIALYQKTELPCTIQPNAGDGIFKRSSRFSNDLINLALSELVEEGVIEKLPLDGKQGRPKKRSNTGDIPGLFCVRQAIRPNGLPIIRKFAKNTA